MQGATTSSSKLVMEEACYSRNARRRCLQYIYLYLFNLLVNIAHTKSTHTRTPSARRNFLHMTLSICSLYLHISLASSLFLSLPLLFSFYRFAVALAKYDDC